MMPSKPWPRVRLKTRAKDDQEILVREILVLPKDLRDLFILNRVAGLTYGQIGLRLGMDAEAVPAAMAAALLRLTQVAGISRA